MKKVATALLAVVLFLTGCGALYIEGASSFKGPIINQSLTESATTPLSWLQGQNVVVQEGRDSFCSSSVVGHTLENWLGLRGAQPVVREDVAEYRAMFYSDHDAGRIVVVRARLRIIDRAGNVKATSKGESSYWDYRSWSWADLDQLCEAAARRAVKNLR